MSLVPEDGYIVANCDDENVTSLLKHINCNKITYGITSNDAMWNAKDIVFDHAGCAAFDVYKNGKKSLTLT